ncbi:uncharacterized protein LOC143352895 isoform X2 [Halictus rubicundus]|uniref:uncharacterized protein LOC143352895 isoform X2 n=1 Tax=Halictus rubicundus TaxID=77578 RepID=UPI0040372485
MNPMMALPMELQLQLHQQMLYHQQQIALRRHRPEDLPNPNTWTLPAPGGGPPLPPGVKVELQNQELWRQFHAETTEMIITKLGRRMFPSIQLKVSGLESRTRYCVLLEVEPASDRRHKYVIGGGGFEDHCENAMGWTSAGPAEPQPRIDRRMYLHPESPATGAHWMQHPLSFCKLKLTNNAVDPRTNNENITKLKIDNNPFAKGFRETGQSRCKRKFQKTEGDRSNRIDDEEGNMSSESESNRTNHLDVVAQRPKTASSETGSLDDSGVSSCGGISPPLPPSMINGNSLSKDEDRDAQPRLHRPWVDSTPKFSSPSSSSLTRHENLLNFPAHYFRLLHPSLAMQQDLIRLQYQSMPQFSKHY